MLKRNMSVARRAQQRLRELRREPAAHGSVSAVQDSLLFSYEPAAHFDHYTNDNTIQGGYRDLGSKATLHGEPSVAQESVFFNQASLHLTTPKIVHQGSAVVVGESSRAKHSIKLPITEALVSSPMAVNSRIDFRGDNTLNQRSVAGVS